MKEMVCLLKSMNKCCQLHIRLDTRLKTRTMEGFAHRGPEQRLPLKVIGYGYCSVCLHRDLAMTITPVTLRILHLLASETQALLRGFLLADR